MTCIRGVIFDMDGVLIDAKEWHYNAFNLALGHYGLNIPLELHEREFDGLPTQEKLRRLSVYQGLPLNTHDTINALKQQYTMYMVQEHCRPDPVHLEALAKLKGAGLALAVASNSIRASIEAMLGRAKLLPYLDFTLSAEDVTRGKPDPEIYRTAIQRLGLIPQECIIVEDNPHGLVAAHASGAHVLKVSDPSEVTWPRLRDYISWCEK